MAKKKRSIFRKILLGTFGLLLFFMIVGLFAEKKEHVETAANAGSDSLEVPETPAPAPAAVADAIEAPAVTSPAPVAEAPAQVEETIATKAEQVSEITPPTTQRFHEADRYMTLCLQPDERVECERNKEELRALYNEAYGGDYQARRNLAYFLQVGTAAMVKNATQSCTWRLIIVASSAKQVDQSDWSNMNLICGRLSEQDLAQAKAQAVTLTTRMTMGDPIDDETIDTTGLDATAHPLTLE
ncbi:hypothetical protein OSH11_21490 [Kaistia dalseonensis]|uniref:Uncharacterized protein n=1 Tax=Kaistia dalseonensis TaxID=410840 RepID=A0ABU0HC91_9HYPH|nr:hypothetical protein [Kaistia dalseonensis]MCX5497285.1 hypothetical protein [Kaistia dalseonensis]MDQ0439921.1 hypothetical protein [Kaistia dalseonensis]